MKHERFLSPEDYQACRQDIVEAERNSVEMILTYLVNLPDYKDKILFLQDLQNDLNNGILETLIKGFLIREQKNNNAAFASGHKPSESEMVIEQLNDLKAFFKTYAQVFMAEYRSFLEFLRLEELQ